MRNLKTWMGRVFVVLLVAIGGVVAWSPAANASTCSPGAGCGVVYNASSIWTLIAGGTYATPGGWCWSDNLPRYGSDPLTCAHTQVVLLPGEFQGGTGATQLDDVDTFRSDAGCVIKYSINGPTSLPYSAFAPAHVGYQRVDDRRGKASHKWIKISDGEGVTINYQACGSPLAKHYVTTWAAANGFQDQWCATDGTGTFSGGGARCGADGTLYKASNYFFCKINGGRVSGSNGTYNDWWLLTDLDAVNSGHDGRSFVSAYYLSGGPNDTQNNVADYWNGSAWVSFPNC